MLKIFSKDLLLNQFYDKEKYNWSNSSIEDTLLLCHFDENYNDSSKYECVCNDYSTSYNDEIFSFDAQNAKFGLTCLNINNFESYWTSARKYDFSKTNWNFCDTDWTIDFWIKRKGENPLWTESSLNFLWSFYDNSNYASFYCNLSYGKLLLNYPSYYNFSKNANYDLIQLPDDNEWHHLAFVFLKNEMQIKFYFDGKWNNKIYLINDTDLENLNKNNIWIGAGRSGYYNYEFYHYIDELRFSKKAIWLKDFKVPTNAYELK